MALTVTLEAVRRESMIEATDTSLDSSISALITEMLPRHEFTIDPLYLADADDADLRAALALGALELISGEFLAQRYREPGFSEEMQVGNIRVGQAWERGKSLTEQGSTRLAPFRKAMGVSDGQSLLLASTGQSLRQFTGDEMSGW